MCICACLRVWVSVCLCVHSMHCLCHIIIPVSQAPLPEVAQDNMPAVDSSINESVQQSLLNEALLEQQQKLQAEHESALDALREQLRVSDENIHTEQTALAELQASAAADVRLRHYELHTCLRDTCRLRRYKHRSTRRSSHS